mmetsp:Transcript_7833/g.11355  ORF Transcript_7833/g.11355 Transcript_7833/m.11355 type:complete len:94 (-) Transcript_7833:1360-1641(-)
MNESAGRSGVVTTDSSTGESPNYGNTGSAEGFAGEFSEDVISHQFGVTFDQPKQSTKVYSDDLGECCGVISLCALIYFLSYFTREIFILYFHF